MAQADGVVANGTGAAVRSDLNGQLAALFTNHSGSSEPSTTYAYQFWADTNANVLKIRNSANNAWITLRELDGTMLIEDGSASTPGLSFASDTNSGLFGGSDTIGFATGGAERLEIGSSEVVFNDPSNDVDFRVESNGNTHMLFVDAGNDRVGIGTSAPVRNLHLATSGLNNAYFHLTHDGTGHTDSDGADIRLNRSTDTLDIMNLENQAITFHTNGENERARIDSSGNFGLGTSSPSTRFHVLNTSGTTTLAHLAHTGNTSVFLRLQNSSNSLGFIGYENSNLTFYNNNNQTAQINSDGDLGVGTTSPSSRLDIVDSVSSTVAEFGCTANANVFLNLQNNSNSLGFIGYQSSDLVFYTNNIEEARILGGGGLTFNGDTAQVNALDDYEEGTWSATLSVGTCTTSDAKYIKIGKLVRASATLSGFSDRSSSQGLQITNPPYASNGGQQAQAAGSNVHRNLDLAINTSYVSSTGNIEFYAATSGSWSQLAYNHLNSSASTIYFFAQYQID